MCVVSVGVIIGIFLELLSEFLADFITLIQVVFQEFIKFQCNIAAAAPCRNAFAFQKVLPEKSA